VTRSSKWLVLVTAVATATAGMAVVPVDASAQQRAVPRTAARSVIVVAARPHRPFLFAPVVPFRFGPAVPFSPFGPYAWYGGWYGWRPYYAQPYPYPRFYADYSSAARIRVQPNDAEVYIDGHFVGTVDHFDGWTQRLRVAPGERELTIYLEGYQTYRRNVLFRPGATITIQHEMQPLAPGDPQEARPTPAPAAAPQPSVRRPGPQPRPGAAPPAPRAQAREYGAIEIRVQPADAEILVNGEAWESPEPGSLTIDLADGVHRVEIRKDGFRTYSADVRVVGGQVTTVNVSLSPE
jgi:hypothetical protein